MMLKSSQKLLAESWCHICNKPVDRVATTTSPENLFDTIVIAYCHGHRVVYEFKGERSDGRNFKISITGRTKCEQIDSATTKAKTNKGKTIQIPVVKLERERLFSFD